MRTKILAAAMLALLSISPAHASSISNGRIKGFETVGTPSGHVVFVFIQGSRINGTPACSNPALPDRWALDPTTPMGQATYSLLLTARAMNEPITIYGWGGCDLASDAETIIYAATNNVIP